jgi:hypothetical protein
VNTPQHQRGTTDVPSCVPPVSTSDTPIYDGLVRETYGDQGGLLDRRGLLADHQPTAGPPPPPEPPTERSATEPATAIMRRVHAALSKDMPTRVRGGRETADVRQPEISGELPKRKPGKELPPEVRQPVSGVRGVPRVPEARQPDTDSGWWFQPASGQLRPAEV